MSETGFIVGMEGGGLSLTVLGTWNQRKGDRGGNCERHTAGSGNVGVKVTKGLRGVLHCIVSSCALPLK